MHLYLHVKNLLLCAKICFDRNVHIPQRTASVYFVSIQNTLPLNL